MSRRFHGHSTQSHFYNFPTLAFISVTPSSISRRFSFSSRPLQTLSRKLGLSPRYDRNDSSGHVTARIACLDESRLSTYNWLPRVLLPAEAASLAVLSI